MYADPGGLDFLKRDIVKRAESKALFFFDSSPDLLLSGSGAALRHEALRMFKFFFVVPSR